mmetsp:Transcript_2120/g.6645  ORF Transcript_2120/g.6645 Transcript_2120/m.6645 type:complete len:208 (+) Transcript_2120:1450-2073(+)
MDRHERLRRYLHACRHRQGIRCIRPHVAIIIGDGGVGREERVSTPHPATGVVLIHVLAVREDGGEVDLLALFARPAAPVLCLCLDVLGGEEIGVVLEIELADGEHVGDDGDVTVGHAGARPHRRRARRVRKHMEDPDFLGVTDDKRLTSRRVGILVVAVLLGELARSADGASRRIASFHDQHRQLLDAEQRLTALVDRLGVIWWRDR